MNNTIINTLNEYFLTCPFMSDKKINVESLPEKSFNYTIDTMPSTDFVKKYIGGSSKKQYAFIISSVNEHELDQLQSIANSGFFEELSDWLENQSKRKNLPSLPKGKRPLKIEAQSTNYHFTSKPDKGRYQIQCRIIYFEKGER